VPVVEDKLSNMRLLHLGKDRLRIARCHVELNLHTESICDLSPVLFISQILWMLYIPCHLTESWSRLGSTMMGPLATMVGGSESQCDRFCLAPPMYVAIPGSIHVWTGQVIRSEVSRTEAKRLIIFNCSCSASQPWIHSYTVWTCS
jgi:hypothetical protein